MLGPPWKQGEETGLRATTSVRRSPHLGIFSTLFRGRWLDKTETVRAGWLGRCDHSIGKLGEGSRVDLAAQPCAPPAPALARPRRGRGTVIDGRIVWAPTDGAQRAPPARLATVRWSTGDGGVPDDVKVDHHPG